MDTLRRGAPGWEDILLESEQVCNNCVCIDVLYKAPESDAQCVLGLRRRGCGCGEEDRYVLRKQWRIDLCAVITHNGRCDRFVCCTKPESLLFSL